MGIRKVKVRRKLKKNCNFFKGEKGIEMIYLSLFFFLFGFGFKRKRKTKDFKYKFEIKYKVFLDKIGILDWKLMKVQNRYSI